MRFWKNVRADETFRRHDEMRTRVGRAVEAARLAQAGVPAGLGSAHVDVVIARRLDTAARTAATGQMENAHRHAPRGLAPELVRATAQAAREAGRRPEEIWAEALHNWLTAHETSPTTSIMPRIAETRRQRCWSEIEVTLQALRAS